MKPPKIENPRFFELLKKKNIIPEDFIHDLLEELDGNALDVLATLIQSGVGTKRQLCQLWCDSIGIAHVDLEKSLFQSHVVRKIPERFARQVYAIPVYQMGDTITVATATPDNQEIKNEIQQIIGNPINLVFALPQDIEWSIENEYQTNTILYEFFSKIKTSRIFELKTPLTEKKLSEIAGKEAINQLHVCLILFGITENASEIHIDPEGDIAKVYFIVDETFRDQFTFGRPVYEKLLAKLKQLAKLEQAQSNEPHYSRIIFPTPGKKIDIQFLSLPTDSGEKIFLKLMDRCPLHRVPALSELYLSINHANQITKAMNARKGLILISGPPKSGKSTLAYSMIKQLRTDKTSVLTVEDSIKWHLKDIDQYQVNQKADINRKDALSTCLKLRPKAIYIQNINDPEISETVCHETEHENVFFIAGVGAGNVFEALSKAIQLGIHQTLTMIINLQLVRRLCDHCREPYKLSPFEIEKMFIWDQKTDVSFYREKGCPYCKQNGFFDKIGIYEVLNINDNFRKLLNDQTPMANIINAASQLGFKDKEHDGIKKVIRGLTTIKELEAIT